MQKAVLGAQLSALTRPEEAQYCLMQLEDAEKRSAVGRNSIENVQQEASEARSAVKIFKKKKLFFATRKSTKVSELRNQLQRNLELVATNDQELAVVHVVLSASATKVSFLDTSLKFNCKSAALIKKVIAEHAH